MYNALRDYSSVSANQHFYNQLVLLLQYLGQVASAGISNCEHFFYYINAPWISLIFALGYIFAFRTFFQSISHFNTSFLGGPNRLTINKEELSLDKWTYLFSVNAKSIKWADVQHVSLHAEEGTADPNKWSIIFAGKKEQLLKLPLWAVNAQDRTMLAEAIEQLSTLN